MRDNDQQLGKPMRVYRDTKANIQALGLGAADEGCEAYATDTDEFGTFDGAAWVWGVAGGDHGALAGLGDDDHAAVYPGHALVETITGVWMFDHLKLGMGIRNAAEYGIQAALNDLP